MLNGLLLERAEAAGCRVVRSRVSQLETSGERARLAIGESRVEADFVVVAAGARNSLLPGTRPLARNDLEMTLGYFVPAQAEGICVKFLHHFEGYLWSFPRCDHLSVGICGSMAKHTSQELRRHLHAFMESEKISREGARFYSHVLPSPQKQTLSSRRVVGRNWALVGDAAAWVDPITGEGLYYALRSGELLAESLIAAKPGGISRADSQGIFHRSRICNANCAALLSRAFPWRSRRDAHDSVHRAQPDVSRADGGRVCRFAGLLQPETPLVGAVRHNPHRSGGKPHEGPAVPREEPIDRRVGEHCNDPGDSGKN